MKIYTRVVWDSNGRVTEEAGYDYAGPVAECKGTVNIPGPTAEERALQAQQTKLLEKQGAAFEEQQRIQTLLSPFIFESTGVKPIFDPNDPSKIISFEPITDELQPLRSQIEKGFLERTQAALAGELPVNPALLSDLAENERTLRETLRRQLGPGFETSSPGIESLGDFGQRRSELLESARRGDLSLAEQLGLAREQSNELQLRNLLQNLQFSSSFPFQSASGFGQAAAGFDPALNRGIQLRQLQTQAKIAGAQASSGLFGDIFGGIGSIVGLGLAGGGGFKGLFAGAPGAGLDMSGDFAYGLPAMGMCWIAEAIYGPDSSEFHLARYWINVGWQGWVANAVRKAYRRFGRTVAGLADKHGWLRRILRPLFDIAVRKGREVLSHV